MDTTWFDPSGYTPAPVPAHSGAPERDSGRVYEHDERTVLAVRVARATGRPLLLRGPPGTGKSTLARHVANVLGWGFERKVVTSRTRARDLMWEVDAVRRLSDAQLGTKAAAARVEDISGYVDKGVLWKAFEVGRCVVLIDEIDKADPDVPNDLLGPLGSLRFIVEPTGERVEVTSASERDRPLVVVTTNEERILPDAFVRRCVVLHLEPPATATDLITIARLHFGPAPQGDDLPVHALTDARLTAVADRFLALRAETRGRHLAAEFLDAVDAVTDLQLDLETEADAWKIIQGLVMSKAPGAR